MKWCNKCNDWGNHYCAYHPDEDSNDNIENINDGTDAPAGSGLIVEEETDSDNRGGYNDTNGAFFVLSVAGVA